MNRKLKNAEQQDENRKDGRKSADGLAKDGVPQDLNDEYASYGGGIQPAAQPLFEEKEESSIMKIGVEKSNQKEMAENSKEIEMKSTEK